MLTVFSFLGGSVFRMLWGEISHWLTSRQDHLHELDRLKFQAEQDEKQHARNLEAIRVQAEIGEKIIRVQSEAAINELETQAWANVVESTTKQTGIQWLDSWNSAIRPFVATWAIAMITLGEFHVIAAMTDNAVSICSAALGIYLADRNLMKRGK